MKILNQEVGLKLLKQVRLTIGTKLVGLIATLLVISVASLVWLSTGMFTDDTTALIKQTNADTATNLATQTRQLFESTTEKIQMVGTILYRGHNSEVARELLSKDSSVLFVAVVALNSEQPSFSESVSTSTFERTNPDFKAKIVGQLTTDKDFSFSSLAQGESQLTNITLAQNETAFILAIPFVQIKGDRFSHALVAGIPQAKFVKAFTESDIINTYMVDRKGRLVAHPDTSRVASGESVSHLDVVKEMLSGKVSNKQMRYFDGDWKLGAFRMVGFAGLGVVAEVPEAKALETSIRLKYRAMLVGLIILSVAFFFGYAYSTTITYPIRQLMIAAARIADGDFKISLRSKGSDELALLSGAFNNMAKGLEERDRVKETFNKFHSKEIADKLLSGEVKLGGERKTATVFFSDVRGFTGMSEAMQPEEVVEMLNEYMTRMVAVIQKHGGIVDKYVGDAIMALWGVPLSQGNDAVRAVMACLEMRQELAKLNELRLSRGQVALKIGMGLNTGEVIAGNIGSNEKMEYTVIGDTVNLASRIESMTKEYGTDLLISKNVYERVREQYIFEECESAKVKGKSDAIVVYKVKGYFDENKTPVIIQTPYSSYASEKSDKVVHEKAA